MLTENGIELDLKESNYTAEFGSYIFYFSSVNYRDKFLERLKPFILVETIKFKNKYGINLNIQEVFAISLYKKIEKRGFRVINIFANDEVTQNATFALEQVVL